MTESSETRRRRVARLACILTLTAALLAVHAPSALACVACNLAFEQEILGEREGTLAARDIRNAMENQRGLPLLAQATGGVADADGAEAGNGNDEGGDANGDAGAGDAADDTAEEAAEEAAGEADPIPAVAGFADVIERDAGLSIPQTSFVPQDTEPDQVFTVELGEGKTYLGQGVMYEGFLTNGKLPGPTFIAQEGDVIEFRVKNTGTVPHGASIHAAYTQTSKYVGNVAPGETKSVRFRATVPGVYMYHCAPGGHAIPMHVIFGQYGMIVVEPKETRYRLEEELGHGPDVNLYLLQHELYPSGKAAIEGAQLYTAFNGRVFRYIEEPIVAKPGDYVRVHYLNVGPSLTTTFHLVGIVWDYVYWQGHPEAWRPGGQTVTSGPSDSWVIEFRVPPDEGAYVMIDHSVGSSTRGAIGLLVADANAETPLTVRAEGPAYTDAELEAMAEKAVRTISPFGIGTSPVDEPVRFGPDVDEVTIEILGNSYHPKVIEIEPGTKVTWVNEEVFTYMAGEFSGIHNALMVSGPERFVTQMLAHGESDSHTYTQPGTHDYICTPHPYMRGRVIVREPTATAEAATGTPAWLVGLALLAVGLSGASLLRRR